MNIPTYNLLHEPWIPGVLTDGVTHVELSLLDTIERAHDLRCIYGDTPLETASMLRLLLAVVHRAYNGPKDADDWHKIWRRGKFTQVVTTYLQAWVSRFDLFDEEYPWYQDPSIVRKEKSIAKLQPDRASGNNGTLFDSSTDDNPVAVSPAKAARILCAAQAFSLGQLPEFSDSPCTRGLIFFAEGANLFQTLTLSLLPYNDASPLPRQAGDRPAWEMEDVWYQGESRPLGWLDQLTYQSRRIKLLPNPDGTVALMMWGMGLPAAEDPQKQYTWIESKQMFLPMRADRARAIWRDLAALFPFLGIEQKRPLPLAQWLSGLVSAGYIELGRQVSIQAYGMTNYQSRIDGFVEQHANVDVAMLLTDPAACALLAEAITLASKVRDGLWRGLNNLANQYLTSGKDYKDLGDVEKRAIANLLKSWRWELIYWGELEIPFASLFKGGDIEAWKDALRQATYQTIGRCTAGMQTARGLRAAACANPKGRVTWILREESEEVREETV